MNDRQRLENVFEQICGATRTCALDNWTCCQSCGHAEAEDYLRTSGDGDEPWWDGYVFWHWQDDEHSFDREGDLAGPLYLAYSDRNAAQTAIRWLSASGFDCDWSGDECHRVKVTANNTVAGLPGAPRL